jgi:hypothetical protein
MRSSRKRDEFPKATKSRLAGRAGYKCSKCGKSTIGPGEGPDEVASDGKACHIEAASRTGGPRFNPNLEPEERADIQNGIWACSFHAIEIDSLTSTYAVDVLRHLKTAREEKAAKARQARSSPFCDGPPLSELLAGRRAAPIR